MTGLATAPAASADVPSADCRAPGWSGVDVCRADPFFPAGAALGALGSPGSPEDDLALALNDLETAPDPSVAARARGRALAILEGDASRLTVDDHGFLDGKAYAGIPLLNAGTKVKDGLGAGATVDVVEVRYGDHALLDTSMLRFLPSALDTPFRIRWHVTELGTSFGGEFAPVALPQSGRAEHVLVEPLAPLHLATGTTAHSRFHPGGAEEQTRLATQVFVLDLPAPRSLRAILDPNLKPNHETFAQLGIGSTEDPAPVGGGLAGVWDGAPARLIRDDLATLDVAGPDLDAAHAAGRDDGALVAAMRSRDTLPRPDAPGAGADVAVQFANAEAYVSTRALRLAPDTSPDGSLSLSVTNLDGVERTFAVRELRDRTPVFGVLNWGSFATDVLRSVTVAPGATESVRVMPAADAFTLWLGDPDGGDQAATAVALDRGPRRQSLELGLGPVKPLHQALDAGGRLWVTMANSDEVVRLSPGPGALSTGAPEHFPLPGGIAADPPPPGIAPAPVLGPGDVAVDGHGIVWVTLTAANAIARLDPDQVRDGTTAGITVYRLAACTDVTCRKVLGGGPAPLTRLPLQLRLWEDGADNTVMVFTEQNADAIGVLRVAPSGRKLDEQHLNCGCLQPLGIALDPSGDIWFSEGSSNRLGRMTLDQTRPFSADAHTIRHYVIPNPVAEFVPGTPLCGSGGAPACAPRTLPNPAITALPHSVAVDRSGRVWYTGEANERVGYLDPARARPNTSDGFRDAAGPENEFGRTLAPADIAIDGAGTAWFSDEYGDQIASATVRPDGSVDARRAFRPAERNSLTDSPLVDPDGNLWFLEAGANLITRISHVAAGVPLPRRSPLLVANTATGALTASGLPEIASVDVRVVRDGTPVASAEDVAVAGGAFSVSLPLRAEDRIDVAPNGAGAPAPFSFRVASLGASVASDGTVTGAALLGGAPLAGDVTVDAGATHAAAAISVEDGRFSWAGRLDPAMRSGTVSWTAGTVSARFRTVTPFAAAPRPAAPAAPAAPGAPAVAPAPGAATVPARACAPVPWLRRSGRHRVLPLLGLTRADAARCLGAPDRRAGHGSVQRWIYRGSLELRFSAGRVAAFALTGAGRRSTPDRAGVGASLAAFRRALGALGRDGRGRRSVVALGSGRVADVRLAVGSGGRVARVAVTVRQAASLDRAGRRLLRRGRR